MKIKYEFATEAVEIEVEDQWAEVILELNQQEYNNNRRYSDQLNAYRAALNLMYPEKPVEVYAWSLHADTEIIIKAA